MPWRCLMTYSPARTLVRAELGWAVPRGEECLRPANTPSFAPKNREVKIPLSKPDRISSQRPGQGQAKARRRVDLLGASRQATRQATRQALVTLWRRLADAADPTPTASSPYWVFRPSVQLFEELPLLISLEGLGQNLTVEARTQVDWVTLHLPACPRGRRCPVCRAGGVAGRRGGREEGRRLPLGLPSRRGAPSRPGCLRARLAGIRRPPGR